MQLFEYQDYKSSVNDWIKDQPSGGHGQLRQLALYLNVNSVVMSQVFRGDRDLTLDQALSATKYMGFTELERDYFLLLVQFARAGSHELKQVLIGQLEILKSKSQNLKNRIKHQEFNDENKATFYSEWYYSAIRLGLSIPDINSVTAVADYLKLDRGLVAKIVEFLINQKLVMKKSGRLSLGPQVTHLSYDSPFVNRHHSNWRLKGLQSMTNKKEKDLFYSGPMVLSRNDSDKIKNKLTALIEETTEIAKPSDSEELRCLSIDWFGI